MLCGVNSVVAEDPADMENTSSFDVLTLETIRLAGLRPLTGCKPEYCFDRWHSSIICWVLEVKGDNLHRWIFGPDTPAEALDHRPVRVLDLHCAELLTQMALFRNCRSCWMAAHCWVVMAGSCRLSSSDKTRTVTPLWIFLRLDSPVEMILTSCMS